MKTFTVTANGVNYTDEQICDLMGIKDAQISELGLVTSPHTVKTHWITDLRQKFKREAAKKVKQREAQLKRQQNLQEMMPELVEQAQIFLEENLPEHNVFINRTQPNVKHENGLTFYIICGYTYRLGIRHTEFTAEEIAETFPQAKLTAPGENGSLHTSVLVNGLKDLNEVKDAIENVTRIVNLAYGTAA